MKLILYDSNKKVVQQADVVSPVVDGNNVQWEGGSLNGIGLPFLLLNDGVVVDDVMTDGVISLDQKGEFLKVDIREENELLKKQLTDLSFELMVKGVL